MSSTEHITRRMFEDIERIRAEVRPIRDGHVAINKGLDKLRADVEELEKVQAKHEERSGHVVTWGKLSVLLVTLIVTAFGGGLNLAQAADKKAETVAEKVEGRLVKRLESIEGSLASIYSLLINQDRAAKAKAKERR